MSQSNQDLANHSPCWHRATNRLWRILVRKNTRRVSPLSNTILNTLELSACRRSPEYTPSRTPGLFYNIVISMLFSIIPLVMSNPVILHDILLYMSNFTGAMAGRFSMTSESWCILALISSCSWIRSSSPWPWMISWSGGSRLSQCMFPLSATIHRSNWRWISCRLWDTPLYSCRPRPCVLHIVHVIVHINFNRHVVSKILILQKYFVKKFITFILCKVFKNFEYLLEKNFSNTFCLQSFTKMYVIVKIINLHFYYVKNVNFKYFRNYFTTNYHVIVILQSSNHYVMVLTCSSINQSLCHQPVVIVGFSSLLSMLICCWSFKCLLRLTFIGWLDLLPVELHPVVVHLRHRLIPHRDLHVVQQPVDESFNSLPYVRHWLLYSSSRQVYKVAVLVLSLTHNLLMLYSFCFYSANFLRKSF